MVIKVTNIYKHEIVDTRAYILDLASTNFLFQKFQTKKQPFFCISASRTANAGAFNLRQIILGTFDQRIHTTGQADTMDIFNKTYKEILGIETVPGTNMPANFGHMVGYDSQYYGYMVSFKISHIFHSS